MEILWSYSLRKVVSNVDVVRVSVSVKKSSLPIIFISLSSGLRTLRFVTLGG